MRIYVAGPMTGIPEFNYPAFHAAAAALRAVGHQVENPAENPDPACKSWEGYMRMALAQLVTCDAIYLLKGWERSKGARIECDLAILLGLILEFEPGAECGQEYVSGMNWPLPCVVTVGHVTMAKGVALRTLVARMKVLYKMATGFDADDVANRSLGGRLDLLQKLKAGDAA